MATSAATAESDAGEGAEGKAGKKGKGKLFLIIGLVALLAGGGGAYWYFFMRAPAAAAKHVEVVKKPMTYVPMDTFTVNLLDPDQERYLQVNISLGLREAGAVESLRTAMPALRNTVLLLLSNKTAETLMTREGKSKLAEEIQQELGKTLEAGGLTGKGPDQVLFSSFVIQ